jgi:hypothetical protein
MIDDRDVRSVTEFQRNIKEYVGRLKNSKPPLVLSVKKSFGAEKVLRSGIESGRSR